MRSGRLVRLAFVALVFPLVAVGAPPIAPPVPDFAAMARGARDSVVSITASPRGGVQGRDPVARRFFERHYGDAEPPGDWVASGFVVRADGHIVTNSHVVERTRALFVSLAGDESHRYPATVVGRDDPSDLALLKVDIGRALVPLPLGDSEGLAVGDWVAAVGNPFGLSHSLTVGIVSYIGRREINPGGRGGYHDFIQTDASINPGNSGGPLLDRQGRVVGINAAVNTDGQGIGFAIPVRMMQDVLPALYEKGALDRGWLGVSLQDLDEALAASFGVSSGVAVTEVTADGPAAQAGLRPGDVVTHMDGAPVDGAHRLRWRLSTAGAGTRVALTVQRKQQSEVRFATLARLPGAPALPARIVDVPSSEVGSEGFAWESAKGTAAGWRVTAVDPASPAGVAGLREGDRVLPPDEEVSESLSTDRRESLADILRRPLVRLRVQRGDRTLFVAWRSVPGR